MKKALFVSPDAIIKSGEFFLNAFRNNVISDFISVKQKTDFTPVLFLDKGREEINPDYWNFLKRQGLSFDYSVLVDFNVPSSFYAVSQAFDLANSVFVTDTEISEPLLLESGVNFFILNDELPLHDWHGLLKHLIAIDKSSKLTRATSETNIEVQLNLRGSGKSVIKTGIAFFDHMLEQIARHGHMDLIIHAKGDLHIDEHHTVEDVAIVLGKAFHVALGSKKGLLRYGFFLPMDDCLAQVALDFGGRPWLVWDVSFQREKVGELPTELVFHFFKSFSDHAACNLNIKATGDNEHHKIESIFKAFAKAVSMAVSSTGNSEIPSTKGVL